MTGEHLSPDLRRLVRLLAKHRVRYLLVGGEAVIHYGYARLTGELDFFYDRSSQNAKRLFAALREFWRGDVPSIASADELAEADVVVQFGRPPNRIDLLSSLGSATGCLALAMGTMACSSSAKEGADPSVEPKGRRCALAKICTSNVMLTTSVVSRQALDFLLAEVTEDHMLDLEREAFVSLRGEPKSLERMHYMLMNHKPLRN